jgi:hypothetical protein
VTGHLHFVSTPWGGYWIDPLEIDAAERLGRSWAQEAIAEFRRRLEILDREWRRKKQRRKRRRRARP